MPRKQQIKLGKSQSGGYNTVYKNGKVVGLARLSKGKIAPRTGTGKGQRFKSGKKGEPLFGDWKRITFKKSKK